MLSLKCIEKHIAPFIPAVIRQLSTKSRFSFASSDPYVILGLDKTATKKQIKKQYYSLAKRYHPDLNPGNEAAKRMFILIQKSYEELEIRHSPKNQQTVSTEDDEGSGGKRRGQAAPRQSKSSPENYFYDKNQENFLRKFKYDTDKWSHPMTYMNYDRLDIQALQADSPKAFDRVPIPLWFIYSAIFVAIVLIVGDTSSRKEDDAREMRKRNLMKAMKITQQINIDEKGDIPKFEKNITKTKYYREIEELRRKEERNSHFMKRLLNVRTFDSINIDEIEKESINEYEKNRL